MYIFNEEGFQRVPAERVKLYSVKVSEGFIEKHGTKKVREVGRKTIISLRELSVPRCSFRRMHKECITVKLSVVQKIRSVALSRGLTISALVRESLHAHLLNGVEPVKEVGGIRTSISLQLSPFEEKLLNQWRKRRDCPKAEYFSTLAAVLEPMEEPDLVNLMPRKAVPLYPAPVLLEKFIYNANFFSFSGGEFIRQILAFLDRPFNAERPEDRYLDWLTNGYARCMRIS